jgi:peptide subunit release factor 1 (eRF1)
MVDRIRRAFNELEAPICPNCHIEMKWTRSELVAQDTIRHLFHCPNCHRAGEATSKIEAVVVPPEKLTAPAIKRAA